MTRQHSRTQYFKFAVIALATILVSQVPTLAFGKTKDVTPPKVILSPGAIVSGVPVDAVPTGKAFAINYFVKDDSKSARVTFSLYSNGSLIRKVSSGSFVAATGKSARWQMNAVPVPKKGPEGVGPYYVCIGAQDGAGNRSLNFPKTMCSWLAIEVPIALVSNGCGGSQWGAAFGKVQSWFLNEQTYGHVVVDFKKACDLHDAGYSGVAVMDPVMKMIIDYRPWTRKMVDEEFQQNLQFLCDQYLGNKKVSNEVYKMCNPGSTLAKVVKALLIPLAPLADTIPGAQTYYDAVRSLAKSAFDTDPTQPGVQKNNMPRTFPVGGGRNNL